MQTPALNRLGYILDPESGNLVRNDKRGRKMPKRAGIAALDRWLAEHPRPVIVDEDELPF